MSDEKEIIRRSARLPGEKRRFKCPLCNGGCSLCNGGYIEIGFASGSLYTSHCQDCGKNNGAYIVNESHHLPATSDLCVWCKSENTIWSYLTKITR